jgi:phage-related protein
MRYFKTLFLEEARKFMANTDAKTNKKIIYTIEIAERTKDPRLFKKVHENIWEFRIRYGKQQIRLLAFWDKSKSQETLVVVSQGFIKKTSKIPSTEINKALKLRADYFN